jgi:glyoxylase-like metal-dependent hydrolase (beta-lactamase superfamily II)
VGIYLRPNPLFPWAAIADIVVHVFRSDLKIDPITFALFVVADSAKRGRLNLLCSHVMKNNSFLRVAVAVLLCGAMWAAYVHGQQLGQEAAKQELVKIKDDLYVLHNDFVPGNTTALITDEGVVLVDDKFAVDHDTILAELKKVTGKPIRYVINTHHHPDHSGGNVKMQQMDVQVVSSMQARENMAGTPRDGRFIDSHPGFPNVTFENHMQIHLGGKRLELYYFGRAHTNGDIVVYFPAERTLATGDIFTFGDVPPFLIDYAGGGSAKEWTKTLDSAMQLDFDTVVPGHGTVTTKQEMRNFRDSTLTLRNRVHEMVVQKKTRDEIARMLQSDYHWIQLLLDRSLDGLIAELQ